MSARPNPRRFRPALEALDTRDVPAFFVVNSTADLPDSNPGDGIASTGFMINGQAEVTLRAAIMEANGLGVLPQPHTISFQVNPAAWGDDDGPPPPPPTMTILLTQPMNDIRVPLVIDGASPDRVTITRDTTASAFPYFSVAAGAGAPTDITVEFKYLTIRDAQGAQVGAGSTGGAINNAATLTLTNVDLLNNKANQGGAIYNATTGTLTLRNCLLSENQTVGAGGEGGAIRATGNSRTYIYDSRLSYNQAYGGKGGAISFNNQAQVSLSNTDLTNNSAAEGGAVYASVGNAEAVPFQMTGGSVTNNTATVYGGALFLSSTNTRIDGTTFNDNGAVKGGAIYTKTNVLQLLNCIFLTNTATAYGPILAYTGILGDTTIITQTNCFGIEPEDYVFDPAP